MLGQLSWENQSDGGLDLAGCDCWLLVIPGKLGSFCGNLFKNVIDEGVQD